MQVGLMEARGKVNDLITKKVEQCKNLKILEHKMGHRKD